MQHWTRKFHVAFRGMLIGSLGESSFLVHLIAAIGVMLAAWMLDSTSTEWAILLICIALVMSLELINSAMERLARGLCAEQNAEVGKALDIASGAVLLASLLSALVGLLVLGGPLLKFFGISI